MKHLTRIAPLLLCTSAVLIAGSAAAWDSVTRNGVRNFRRNTAAPDLSSLNQQHHLTVQIAKDRVGGNKPGDATDRGVSSLVSCAADFDTTNDFTGCRIATGADLPDPNVPSGRGEWGWLQVRLAADAENESEHFLIARQAATVAGLMPATSLFDPFFVRYPTANARLASPQQIDGLGRRPNDSRLLVGQAWLPSDIGSSDAHTLRSISLLELAELPDFANSLADWAAGNELCPLSGQDGAFAASMPAVEACHRFEMAMGALNVTHFAPLNREIWSYYHGLAKFRMNECNKLTALQGPFYDSWIGASSNYKSLSGAATEAHECEREAMAYEMFGQHFMQDAWSTGHMWNRFGYPQLGQFPADFKVSDDEIPPQFDPSQSAARRAAIALMTGVISGQIHGSKPVIVKLARSRGLPSPGLLADDPLNAPTYLMPYRLGTSDTEFVSDNGKFPGAGDLFWAPSDTQEPSVSTGSKWATERDTLLRCTAKSMLDVYAVGPKVHGTPDVNAQLSGLTSTDPASDQCWKHYATNQSMFAAFGIDIPLFYDGNPNPSVLSVLASLFANDIVLKTAVAPSLGLLAGPQTDAFLSRLKKRMSKDVDHLRWLYKANADHDPLGTDSAQGQIFKSVSAPCTVGTKDCPVKLFDVPPVANTAAPASPPRGVDYADTVSAQSTVPDATLPGANLNLAMSRLFWRGNVERTCRLSLQNHAAALNGLRAKCLAGEATGGNADACTQCVALAELHVPNCGPATGSIVADSKCSVLGTESTSAVPDGLPAYWFDNSARRTEDQNATVETRDYQCQDGFSVAMMWCTGTRGRSPTGVSTPNWESKSTPTCNGGPSVTTFGKYDYVASTELDESEGPDSADWVYPMVTAVNAWTSITAGADPCDPTKATFANSFDADIRNEIAPAPIQAFTDAYLAGGAHPRCGVRQRRWWARESCSQLESEVAFTPPMLGIFYPDSGVESFQEQSIGNPSNTYCMLREARVFSPICSNGNVCNAGGECVSAAAQPVLTVISTPNPSK